MKDSYGKFGAENIVSDNGLRYKVKAPGTIFETSAALHSMSCVKCSKHKPKSTGGFRKLFGARHFLCGDCLGGTAPRGAER